MAGHAGGQRAQSHADARHLADAGVHAINLPNHGGSQPVARPYRFACFPRWSESGQRFRGSSRHRHHVRLTWSRRSLPGLGSPDRSRLRLRAEAGGEAWRRTHNRNPHRADHQDDAAARCHVAARGDLFSKSSTLDASHSSRTLTRGAGHQGRARTPWTPGTHQVTTTVLGGMARSRTASWWWWAHHRSNPRPSAATGLG